MEQTCIPVNVDLYGYKKVAVDPPPTDQLDIAGVKCLRVVLRPHEPTCSVKLAGGHEIHISAWANKTDLSPACSHYSNSEKLREDLREANLKIRELQNVLWEVGKKDVTEPFSTDDALKILSVLNKTGFVEPKGDR